MLKKKLVLIIFLVFFLSGFTLKPVHADIVQPWSNINLSISYYSLGQTFIADETSYNNIVAWVNPLSTGAGQIMMSLYDNSSSLLTSQDIAVPSNYEGPVSLDISSISFTIGNSYMFQLTEPSYNWFANVHYEGYDGEDKYTDGTLVTPKGYIQEGTNHMDPALYDLNFHIVSSSSTVPIPGAVWLLGSGLIGLVGIRRKKINKGSLL
ncbi:MAG: VPLPA-CTERM sorting domain-containing protein [Proteobacteria bacterium]|nr:VPLPA-CTERM sorting domain-containing protein [Pseudomonadota bacterium]